MTGNSTGEDVRQAVEAEMVRAGADAVHEVTSYVAHFGERAVEVRVLDFGPLFRHRYEIQLQDEAGMTIRVGPADTVADCLAAVRWKDLLLE